MKRNSYYTKRCDEENVLMQKSVFPQSEKEAKKHGIEIHSEDNKKTLFPKRLRELRVLKRGENGGTVTQQMLADEIGVTKSTISLYEMGSNVPDAKTIVKLAEYYKVSTDYLLCETDTKTCDMDMKTICDSTGLSEAAIAQIKQWNAGYKGTASAVGKEQSDKMDKPLSEEIINAFIENPNFYSILSQIASLYNTYKTIKNIPSNDDGEAKLNENIFQFSVWRTQNNIYKTILSTVQLLYENEKKNILS